MKQFQVKKAELGTTRICEINGVPEIGENDILVRVERFGFSANNVTYAVAGDTMGYWQFFKPDGDRPNEWGVIPVWGFAEIIQSNVDDLKCGERLFGYFPPATHLVLSPTDIGERHFFDGSEHRSELARGYNIYRRVEAEPGYNKAGDNMQMLLYPLYITSYSLWDYLKENDWFGAEQIALVSASSKTSIGLAYALQADKEAPKVVALTSAGNKGFVESLGIYDSCVVYDEMEQELTSASTAIVDMSGNSKFLGRMHSHLGDAMAKTINVGITHWEDFGPNDQIIRERSEFFFAPSQIQKRMKEWGPEEFGKRSSTFFAETVQKSGEWMKLQNHSSIDELPKVFASVLTGRQAPQDGLVFEIRQ